MKKRLLALLLAVVMIAGMIPTIAAVNPMPARVIRPDTTHRATYTFYAGGTEVDKQIVKNGEKLTEPAAPTGEGKFLGWYVEDATESLDFANPVSVTANADVNVVARFEDVQYLLFMDEENGRVVDCKTLRKGDTVQTSDVTFPVGTEQDVTGWVDKNNTPVTEVAYGDEIDVLYAVVSDGHWLTFDTNGGSYIAPQFFTDTPDEPTTNPTKSGYTFSGWYLDEKCMHPAVFSNIDSSTIVYANWIAEGNVQYTVLHMQENANDDGYSTKDIETKSGQAGFTTNAKPMSYQGFTAKPITQQTINGDGSTIVKVYYERNVYQVKFYYHHSGFFGIGGRWEEDTNLRITAKYGANISKQWPGGAWHVGPNSSTWQANIDTMPLDGKNFYKQSDNDSATASYYLEVLPGESGDTQVGGKNYKLDHQDNAPSGSTVTSEDRYPITGFTCNTEYSAKDGKNYNKAKFYYDCNSYNLIFISGAQNVKNENVKFGADISGKSYTPTTPPAGMDGYVFNGWYNNELCKGDAYDFTGKTMPAQNVTLHAKWVAPVHTVTFWKGDTKLDEITRIAHGTTITEAQAPTVTVGETEEFYGWTLLDGTPFNFDTKITEDYNLYARVGSEKGYKLTYSVNGDETLVKDDYHYAKDTPAVVKNYTPADTDKVFLGWAKTEGGNVAYRPGATIKMTADTILYAVFGDKTGTVSLTYHSNFDAQTYAVENQPNNEKLTVLGYDATGMNTREGHSFRGWNTKADGTGYTYAEGDSAVIDNVDAATTNHLYAVWQINSYDYTVEYYIDGTKDDNLTETDSAPFDTVINSYPDKCPTGYKFEKHENIPLTIGTDESANVIKVYYVKDTFKLTINYVFTDGTTAHNSHTESLAVDATYDVPSPTINGYTADRTTVSGTMPSNDVTETVTYTKRTDLSYTVNYYWNTTTDKVAESKTVTGKTYQEVVTESPIAVEGYTAVSSGSKNLTIGTSALIISKMDLLLKSLYL